MLAMQKHVSSATSVGNTGDIRSLAFSKHVAALVVALAVADLN
jgi:hypothetical protein